jgi:hypothetical protein
MRVESGTVATATPGVWACAALAGAAGPLPIVAAAAGGGGGARPRSAVSFESIVSVARRPSRLYCNVKFMPPSNRLRPFANGSEDPTEMGLVGLLRPLTS